MTSKNACKKRWVQNPYYLRKLSIDGACELTGKQFFAHGSLSDSRNESCNLFSINSMQIYASEIIFTSKFQTATRQYTDSLLYATPFHSFHSVYKAKQYSWDCSTNNLQKTCFLQHGSSQIEDLVIAAFLTSEKSRVLVMPFWMCLCIKKHICICTYQKGSKYLFMSTWNGCVFYWRDIFFKKTWLSAYWRRCPHTGGVKSRFQQKISWITKSWLIMQIINAFK